MESDIINGSIEEIIPTITPDPICCGVLEKMDLNWMTLEDGSKCMPFIYGKNDDNMYRVNNCPSCGKYVREVIIKN